MGTTRSCETSWKVASASVRESSEAVRTGAKCCPSACPVQRPAARSSAESAIALKPCHAVASDQGAVPLRKSTRPLERYSRLAGGFDWRVCGSTRRYLVRPLEKLDQQKAERAADEERTLLGINSFVFIANLQEVIVNPVVSKLAFVQTLGAGVYVAMNGRCFDWHSARKNRQRGNFETVSSPGQAEPGR